MPQLPNELKEEGAFKNLARVINMIIRYQRATTPKTGPNVLVSRRTNGTSTRSKASGSGGSNGDPPVWL